ncbi:MAG: patatin-like phospholipase family protein [Chitinophagaceae bacterium]|nr:patatin-like phospholipase family protein [Chitinophagaceae bacterium]
MKTTWLIALLLLANSLSAQPRKHGIGLTLSGGGAKGLAHIGILKAIDSAGLNIDYLTGTSMGSIVGGLYAAGYSADSIEKIARSIQWEGLLSNTISMRSYTMEEKSEFGKYALELPFSKGKIGLPSGFLESQELWLTLEQYFFPVAQVRDFRQFSIPFSCVAVDLVSAEPKAHRDGSIVAAIRSSMAIPGAFSPVDINGRRYVDGGIIRNLPVQECLDLGARYMIGVSVSTPVEKLEELNTAVQVLGQVMFLNEPKDSREQAKLCQQFISVPMGSYGAASFASAADIIDLGIAEGRKYYPLFKRLADSLRRADPNYQFRTQRLPAVPNYRVAAVEVKGVDKVAEATFLRQIEARTQTEVDFRRLQNNTRDAFAYRMYKSIVYDVEPVSDSAVKLIYQVKPESPTIIKLGLSENSFTRFGVHANITSRNLLLPSSRTMLSLNIGDNFRGLFEHLQMFGYRQPWSHRLQVYSEYQDVPDFQGERRTGIYSLRYFTIDNRLQLSAKRRSAGGFGLQWENIRAKPQIESGLYFDGSNQYWQVYGFWQFNNTVRPQYPDRGTIADVKLSYVFGLRPNFEVFRDGVSQGSIENAGIEFGNYPRLQLALQNTAPLGRRWAWISKLQSGINFSRNVSLLNNFFGGGMAHTFRNQIQFAGLREGELSAESMAAVHLGPRVRPFGNFYLSLAAAALHQGFVKKTSEIRTASWALGSALTAAYLTPIGPAELSLMASDQAKGLRVYFNFGFPFR